MRRTFIFNFIILLFPLSVLAQNVGVGTNNPNSSAKLDISATDRGLLIPRVNLTDVNTAAPITAPATGLLVFNTNAAITGGNGEGFYYWSGTGWKKLLDTIAPDPDSDPTNELQTISQTGSNVTLSNGGGTISLNDADADPANEFQTLSLSGNDLSLSNGGGTITLPTFTEVDGDVTNELQTISIAGNNLSLSNGGGTVTLPTLTEVDGDVTNELQTISQTGSDVTLSNGGGTISVNDADSNPSNEIQTLSLSGNDVSLSNGGGTITLPSFTEVDGDVTNELQTISQTGSNVTLSNGGGTISVNDADSNPTNEIQTLSISNTTISLSASGGSVNLPANSLNQAGIVSAPTASNPTKVWATDAAGNPDWRNANTLVGSDADANDGLTVNYPDIDLNVQNGIRLDNDNVKLGGNLIEHTTIPQGNFDMLYDLTGTGNFEVRKSGATDLYVSGANGNVGIGVVPTRAVLEQNGMVANTAAIFGGNTSGVALTGSWPGIYFNAYENTAPRTLAAGFSSSIITNPANGDIFIRTHANGAANAVVAATSRIAILNGGDVGIGTNTPGVKLDVNGAIRTNNGFVANDGGTGNPSMRFTNDGNSGIYRPGANTMGFVIANTERGRFNATGLQLGLPSGNTGALVMANATNANTVTLNTGTTTASYTLTLPTAQASAAGQVLSNNGSGILSWITPLAGTVTNVSGTAPINVATGSTTPVISLGTVPVTLGGTGLTTLTSNGILYGNGTGNVNLTAAPTGGQLLMGNASGVPTFTTMSGDATISPTGVITLNNNNNGYIKNQFASAQPTSNFWIAGSGRMDVGLTVGAGATIDNNSGNTGSIASNALAFGNASGEGIASKRNAGGNQFGLDFYTASVNRMAITNTGNVGIGTTTPGATLNVIHQTFNTTPTKPTGNWAAIIENNQDANDSRNGLSVVTRWGGVESKVFEVASYWSGSAQIYTPIMTALGNRNVGIGTATPGSLLHLKSAGTNNMFLFLDNSSATAQTGMVFHTNGTQRTNFYYDPSTAFGTNGTLILNNFGVSTPNLLINPSTGNVGIGASAAPNVKLAINGTGTNVYSTDLWTENNIHVQGNENMTQGGRGRLRVGSAWGYSGLYTETTSTGQNNDLVLGASSALVRVGGNGAGQNLKVSALEGTGNRYVYADANGVLRAGTKNMVYAQDRNTYSHDNTNAGYRVTGAVTGTLAVETGDIVLISHTSKFRWAGGSGGDHPFYGIRVSGACGNLNVTEFERIGTADDLPRGQWQTIAGNFVWVATCSGNVSFQLLVDNNSDADDSSDYRDIVITAVKY